MVSLCQQKKEVILLFLLHVLAVCQSAGRPIGDLVTASYFAFDLFIFHYFHLFHL